MRCETLIIIFYLYKKNKTLEFNRGIDIPMFFYIPMSDTNSIRMVLFISFQYKSVVCFIAYLLPKSICDI